MQQQQQQPGPMFPVMPSLPPTNITTEQIQKYLDENKKLILAILDNQNLGKLAECAQYQALLQKNLMYLAAIADAQPQTVAVPPQQVQMAPHPSMQQGGFYMQPQQQQQQQQIGQQPNLFHPRPPFNSPHTVMQNPHLPPAQSQPPQMQMPIGISDNANLGGIPHMRGIGNNYINSNNNQKQEKPDGGRASDGQGSSAVGDKDEEAK